MRKRWLRLAAVPVAFAFVAAACSTSDDDDDAGETEETTADGTEAPADTGGEDTEAPADTGGEGTEPAGTGGEGGGEADLAGTEVTVFGSESSDDEAGAMQDALNVFAEENGMTITFVGARDFEEQINSQVAGGNPPDIAIFPQPGKLRDFAASEDVFPLPDDVLATAHGELGRELARRSGRPRTARSTACPVKSDLKSLVWYSPAAFEEKGYEVPETFDDFVALTERDDRQRRHPAVRRHRVRPGDRLAVHRLDRGDHPAQRGHRLLQPVGRPRGAVQRPAGRRRRWQQVADLWATEGMVYAAGGSIAATPFGDNAQALVDGNCMMHRQANFFASFFPEGTEFGDGPGAIDTFYFPSTTRSAPILVAGTSAAAFRDAPEVWAVMNYYGSLGLRQQPPGRPARPPRRRARRRRTSSGFLSAATSADPATTARSSRASSRCSRPASRPASTPPTRCPARSARARSGRRPRRSSTARRTPKRRPTPSRRPGRPEPLRDSLAAHDTVTVPAISPPAPSGFRPRT